jgi:hypothetical protein
MKHMLLLMAGQGLELVSKATRRTTATALLLPAAPKAAMP